MTDKEIIELLQKYGANEKEAEQCLISRDAIIKLIEKYISDDDIQMTFNYALYDQLPKEISDKYAYTYVVVVKATARQLCIAIIKTIDSIYSSKI